MSSKHTSNISIEIELDENRVPENMTWNAPDGGVNNESTKAFMLGVWDDKNQEALRIDLWTKDMPVDQMKVFFHQTFVSMAATLERATEEKNMAEDLRDFASHFADKFNLLKK